MAVVEVVEVREDHIQLVDHYILQKRSLVVARSDNPSC